MWKFNKWLFLSQCSYNWWPEIGMDVRQRFWFSELIVIRISSGGWELEPAGAAVMAPQDLPMWHKQNKSGVGMVVKNIPSLVYHIWVNWCIMLHKRCFKCIKKCRSEQFNREEKWKTGTSLRLCIFHRGSSIMLGDVYFYIKSENSFFPVLAQSIRELCHSKFSSFPFH